MFEIRFQIENIGGFQKRRYLARYINALRCKIGFNLENLQEVVV